jgi:hypothetical protein
VGSRGDRTAAPPAVHALAVGASDGSRLYASAKREAVGTEGPSGYNDLKAAVVYDIYERAFLADQTHHHEPQPRPTSAVMGWTMGQRS